MSVSTISQDLKGSLSPNCSILVDPDSDAFKERLRRWSSVGLQTPAAIVKAATEEDVAVIACTVKYAVEHSIPFVPVGGRHSLWSTIGQDGFILDLSLQKGIEIDKEAATVKIQAGVLTKELNVAVTEAGFCIATSNARSVGVIPALLGGGFSSISPIHGLGIDNLLSARVVTATHGLVVASPTENPDLFWALQGTGQAFGVVTEITVKLHPLSTLGAEDGKFWTFTFIYGQGQVQAVAETLERVSEKFPREIIGMALMAAPPPNFKALLAISIQFFGPEEQARHVLAPFFDLNPINQTQTRMSFDQISDSTDHLDKKGGYKYLSSTGRRKISATKLADGFRFFADAVDKRPELRKSMVGMSFYNPSRMQEVPDESTAWGHRNISAWAMAFPFTDDAETFPLAEDHARKFLEYVREEDPEKIASFPNHTRERPAHERYPGAWRLERLRALKREWDPKGVFPQDFS